MIGGVAGGLAARLDIDPLIVRGAFVVLAVAGGGGILLYLLGWLLLAEDGAPDSIAGQTLGARGLGHRGAPGKSDHRRAAVACPRLRLPLVIRPCSRGSLVARPAHRGRCRGRCAIVAYLLLRHRRSPTAAGVGPPGSPFHGPGSAPAPGRRHPFANPFPGPPRWRLCRRRPDQAGPGPAGDPATPDRFAGTGDSRRRQDPWGPDARCLSFRPERRSDARSTPRSAYATLAGDPPAWWPPATTPRQPSLIPPLLVGLVTLAAVSAISAATGWVSVPLPAVMVVALLMCVAALVVGARRGRLAGATLLSGDLRRGARAEHGCPPPLRRRCRTADLASGRRLGSAALLPARLRAGDPRPE